MDINVTGRKMNVGEALTNHVQERLLSIADKYFSRTIDAAATFTKEGHITRSDISFHANQGINLQGRAEADDPYAAFELAAEKVEKQLRRYKRRLKNHHATPKHDAALELSNYSVIAPEGDNDDDINGAVNGVENEAQPIIIAESKKAIPNVTVGDAVMMMDLADANAFMFRNKKSSALEVVYRRTDGNIGWISPGAE